MQLQAVLKDYIHECFLDDPEAPKAVAEFLKNIPNRILQINIDPNLPAKHGYKKDDTIYKFETNPVLKTVFFEYYENSSQGAPTMGLLLDRMEPKIKIIGTKVHKRFSLKFILKDGAIQKTIKILD